MKQDEGKTGREGRERKCTLRPKILVIVPMLGEHHAPEREEAHRDGKKKK